MRERRDLRERLDLRPPIEDGDGTTDGFIVGNDAAVIVDVGDADCVFLLKNPEKLPKIPGCGADESTAGSLDDVNGLLIPNIPPLRLRLVCGIYFI
jgi:hypothetical protein